MSHPAPLRFGSYYHIYNRGINRGNIFFEERNYAYFLRLYAWHVVPIVDTYAYCLLRNHFHLLVRVRMPEEQIAWRRNHHRANGSGVGDGIYDPSRQFANLFNAYTKAINKEYGRTGALFQRPFGRREVTAPSYFSHLVVYIHQNPQRHGLIDDFRLWRYSSYQTLLSQKPSHVARDEVLRWFDGQEGYELLHEQYETKEEILSLFPDDVFYET